MFGDHAPTTLPDKERTTRSTPAGGTAEPVPPTNVPEEEAHTPAKSKLFAIVAYAAIVVGFFSAIGGVFGLTYTYNTAAAENITTPDDARIAEAPVRGPLTMWAQADIVTHHQLERTEGLRYAEMPRQIEQLDEAGNPVIGEDGQPVMVPNQARLSWLDATTIITSLSLGMISYAFSLFALVVGLVFLGMGFVILKLEKAVAAA